MRFPLPKQILDPGGRKRRIRELSQLTDAWPHELEDVSIGGRKRMIELLETADRIQRQIRTDQPDAYWPEFHLRIRNAIRREREAFAAMTRGLPADHPALQLRLV